jgi:potassium-dependent mechanosensitive channel
MDGMTNNQQKFLLLFIFMGLIFGEAHSQEEAKKAHPVPNPLELSSDWWQYFESADDFPNKVEKFQKELSQLKSSLEGETHKETSKIIDQIFLILDLIAQKKEEKVPKNGTQLQLLKSYSLDQLLEANTRWLKIGHQIGVYENKIEVLKLRLNRLQSHLDRAVLRYQQLPPSSFERLNEGLQIIQLRAELALQNLDLVKDKERLTFLVKDRDLLTEELKIARERLSMDSESQGELVSQVRHSSQLLKEARDHLFLLEKRALSADKPHLQNEFVCCLEENRAFTQSITVENLSILALINQMKLFLNQLSQDKAKIPVEEIQTNLVEWRRALNTAREQFGYWQQKIKEEQAELSRLTLNTIQEEEQSSDRQQKLIGEIHFEFDKSFARLEQLEINIENGRFLTRLVEARLVQQTTLIQGWWISAKSFLDQAFELTTSWTQTTLFRVSEHPVTLMILIRAILLFFGALLLSHYIRKMLVKRKVVAHTFSKSTEYILLRLMHYVIVGIALLLVLSLFGLDFTNLAIVAGALGVGIGFGLQTMASNIVSGFMLLIKKYLKVGDVIDIGNELLGTITAVNLQYTSLRTFDGAEVLIPNSQLSAQRLTNWTMKDTSRRFHIPFGVSYGTDKEVVRKKVIDAVKQLSFVHTDNFRFHDPQVWLTAFADSSVNFELVAWVDLNVPIAGETAKSALMWELDNVLKENGIEIPFPQRDLNIKEFPKSFKDRSNTEDNS